MTTTAALDPAPARPGPLDVAVARATWRRALDTWQATTTPQDRQAADHAERDALAAYRTAQALFLASVRE